MKLGAYLFFVLLLGVVFDFVEMKEAKWFPPDGIVHPFIFNPTAIHLSSFIYYLQETLTYIALSLLIFFRPNHFFKMFVILQAMDMFDFWATGNTAWFYYRKIPITFNIVMVVVFLMMIYYEFIQYVRSGNNLT